MRNWPGLLALVLGASLAPVVADERPRLAAERQALEQRFAREEQDCSGRFAVNACIDEVRARRRAALAPLREQELRLAEAERRRRADERREGVARKQQALQQRLAAEPPPRRELPPAASAASAAAAAPAAPPVVRTRDRDHEATEAARRADQLREAQQRAAAAEARVRERRARQAEALARKGRQPDTLPRPGAAASAPAR